ncbi:MAG: transcriptional regulator [Candidatus Aegiribacteria sp.]|nr:transcriptional regulator [Candidatus Aegiribacteria sp.]
MEKAIKDIEKGEDMIRIELSEFKGNQYIGARIYYMDDKGDWKPTRKGLTLVPEVMVQVRDAINNALEELG